jgi:ferredoxin-NADP reductase
MVEKAAQPSVTLVRRRLLRAARALTTPLLPDDYFGLLSPRWSTREATGRILRVTPEADDAATIVIAPSHAWAPHKPGQYVRVGAEIDGVRHWRAYSITSDPGHPDRLVSITVKRVEAGLMSPWLVRDAWPGTVLFLGEVEGTFGLPDRLPAKLLAISAGSGITPVMSLLRELDRRDAARDVAHLHSARTRERFIFGSMLRDLAARRPGYRLHEQLTGEHGRLTPADLERRCPDWREREVFLSGPPEMIDAFEAHWLEHGDERSVLHVERFQPVVGTGAAVLGSGGSVTFRAQGIEARCDVGVSILVGGEQAGALVPYGCRMGVCHTCVARIRSGCVRDLRTGEVLTGDGQTLRTCVNAPEGPVELEL